MLLIPSNNGKKLGNNIDFDIYFCLELDIRPVRLLLIIVQWSSLKRSVRYPKLAIELLVVQPIYQSLLNQFRVPAGG